MRCCSKSSSSPSDSARGKPPDVVGRAFPDQEAIARDAAGLVNQGGSHRPVAIVERGLVQRRQDPRERVLVAHGEFLPSAKPGCGFFARRIAGSVLQALPRRLVTTRIGRIRKETIQEAAEAGELPDDEHVARSARAHAAVESRAVVAGTGREVVVDVDSVDARGLQCVAL